MLSAGHYYKLRVNRISDFGLYLSDVTTQLALVRL